MNKKKFKEEYNTTAVFNNLTSLMKEEQIINKQKVLLYLKYKTYSELLTKEKEKNKRLEEENKKLNEKKENESKEIENKENLNNLNLNVDLNQLEIYAHKRNCDEGDGEGKDDGDKENRNQNKNQNRRDYELDNSNHNLPFDSLTSLNSLLESKDNKIIELENKVIKLQIIRRLENNKSPLNQPVDFDNSEIINLKSKLEFIKIESERDKKNLNSKLKEFMIKYEETKSKYDSCYSQLKNSLLNLEEIRKFHMSRDVNKIKKIVNLSKEMKGMEYVIKDLENQIYGIEREYLNLCEYFEMHERVNRDRGCNKGRVGEGGRGKDPTSTNPTPTTSTTIPTTPSTDSFYENEISNLLQVCDSLTEQNILLEGQRDDLQSQMDFLKRRNLSLEKDFEMIRLKDSSSFDYIQTYLNKINELSDSIQEICKKLENSNLERNKLTKLNVERISLIEKYKEDLRNKEIEFNILKNNYKEILEENDKKKEDKSNDPIIILCNLCESNPKNVALISCMHTFCDECIESRIKFRNRRCPTCGLPFGSNDVKKVYL